MATALFYIIGNTSEDALSMSEIYNSQIEAMEDSFGTGMNVYSVNLDSKDTEIVFNGTTEELV